MIIISLVLVWLIWSRISGITGVEVLASLHWYLKYWCGSHISWQKTGGAQLFSVPKLGSLPHVQDDRILVQRPIPWNYYQNAVTSSCELLLWLSLLSPNKLLMPLAIFQNFVWWIVYALHLFAFERYFCLVGLGKMGTGNWLDGSPRYQLATSIYWARNYLEKGFPGNFLV